MLLLVVPAASAPRLVLCRGSAGLAADKIRIFRRSPARGRGLPRGLDGKRQRSRHRPGAKNCCLERGRQPARSAAMHGDTLRPSFLPYWRPRQSGRARQGAHFIVDGGGFHTPAPPWDICQQDDGRGFRQISEASNASASCRTIYYCDNGVVISIFPRSLLHLYMLLWNGDHQQEDIIPQPR
jgi:hypothetical protein